MKIILCLFVVVAMIATGEAIKCYQCYIDNPKCDAFDKSDSKVTEQDCPDNYDRCVKNSALLSNGTSLTNRGCAKKTSVSRAADVTIESASTFYCNSDLCNGVSSTGAALTTLMVLIVPLIFTN